jgi:acyl-CoA thioesterase-2
MEQTALDELIEILDLEELELSLFRGRSPQEERQRVFGGQVAGQALVAACRTVEDRSVHSLHSYFLRPGDPNIPIVYQVDRLRDGRSFCARRVTAIQHGHAIFALAASFQAFEESLQHQAPMPATPPPDDLPTFSERIQQRIDAGEKEEPWMRRPRPIDTRMVEPMDYTGRVRQEPSARVWIRANGKLPDDPVLHTCVVAYASDMTLLDTAARPHPIAFDDKLQLASLDHAMWFHRTGRADDWVLLDMTGHGMIGSRGLATGLVFDRAGTHLATVAQEGLLRAPRRKPR